MISLVSFLSVKYSTIHNHITFDGKIVSHSHFYLGSNPSEKSDAQNKHKHDQEEYAYFHLLTVALAGIISLTPTEILKTTTKISLPSYRIENNSNTFFSSNSLRAPPQA